MQRALRELVIVGIPTSQAFHLRVLADPEFTSGHYDITYLDRRAPELLAATEERALEAAAIAAALAEDALRGAAAPAAAERRDAAGESGWRRSARVDGLR
jgi:acetyl/propionyl-CoA carboxylase alpha subunit